MTLDAAVIGGGVSGLAAAYELTRMGHRVAVLERQVSPGGNAISERIGDFLMEHGPSSVNGASCEASTLSTHLGLDGQRCELGDRVRYRYLVGDGQLRRIAIHPFAFFTARYLSLAGRLRLMAEPFVPPSDGDATVAEFLGRRFGREFVDRVIDPLVGGLFGGTADGLSMSAVFPRLVELERTHGSITAGMISARRRGATMPARQLFSWRDGIGTLPRVLAARLGPSVRTGVTVRRLTPTAAGFRIDAGAAGAFEVPTVVVATQPHVAAGLLEGVDLIGAEVAGSIDAPPLAVVFLGYRRDRIDHPLDGIGYLSPRSERQMLTGAQFCSTMFACRAPDGHVAVAGYAGGGRAPDLGCLPRNDLVALARDEFGELLGARGEPVVARVRQWPRGLPLYTPGHDRRIAALRAAEQRQPGLFLTGNYFAGPSVAACLAQASETSARAHRFLSRLRRQNASAVGA